MVGLGGPMVCSDISVDIHPIVVFGNYAEDIPFRSLFTEVLGNNLLLFGFYHSQSHLRDPLTQEPAVNILPQSYFVHRYLVLW